MDFRDEYPILNDEIFGLPPVHPRPLQSSAETSPNSDPATHSSTGTFTCFPRLPAELRLQIWRYCLPHNGRFLSLYTVSPWPTHTIITPEEKKTFYTKRNNLGNIISNCPYIIQVSDDYHEWFLTMLLINREASHVLVSRYRLQMDAKTASGGIKLYIDPETDIVEIFRNDQNHHCPEIDAVVALLHDTVANDPRGLGISHLALGSDCNDLYYLATLDVAKINPMAVATVSTLLSTRIKTFYAVVSLCLEARHMLGQFSWMRGPYHHNRSYPMDPHQGAFPDAHEFSILPEDPRPIELDLKHVAVGTDPRYNMYAWYHALAKFGVPMEPAPPMQVRYLLTIRERSRGLNIPVVRPELRLELPSRRQEYLDSLRTHDTDCVKAMEMFGGGGIPHWGLIFKDEEEYNRSRREIVDVAGAWIFGSDAFGEIPYEANEEDPRKALRYDIGDFGDRLDLFKPKMVVDLSKHKRPELMVFRI